ncbi:MAG: crossover junction endodeoxyribonuclease RuvC [Acidimicrobiaceae bacterium]|nr:crossover junction endodeoxyribonuclease RuvC [Acidimicrobiaceae bacterium]HAQ23355.1 crossover junction endodeoxyribonuclease RuvC [Acidimicrobiaceae bacterium]|tara:strand:- start:516 stop:1031 length:516 start_codon:yes stop_codon:yes gene_type:complete
MFVLGVDPGLTRCGYGVIRRDGSRLEALAAGVLRTDSGAEPAVRLADLHREVGLLVDEYRPDEVAIERVLFQVNVRTAMQTGQASGVVMAAVAGAGIPVTLYSPNEVKEAVAGWGNADKEQVERMVRTQLGIDTPLRPVDAADAVAVALCHLARMAPTRRGSERFGDLVVG